MRLLVVLLLLAVPAAAYEEAEAQSRWFAQFGSEAEVSTAHMPEAVREGEQFQGYLRVPEGHHVSAVDYQVCIVAEACIIAPRPATRMDTDMWEYDTSTFRSPLSGKPHPWLAGDWIGVQWFLTFEGSDEPVPFPQPLDEEDPACAADYIACSSTHYFTFHILPDDRATPVGLLWLVVLAGIAWRQHGRP